MSEQAVLWLLGILIAALGALVIALAKIFWNKLSAIDSGALAVFLGRDQEREKQWMFWRTSIDKRLDAHADELKDHGDRIKTIERNGH